MVENFRTFRVNDLFGAPVDVEFRWVQNGIAIRHADTIDVKFEVTAQGPAEERVIALPLPALAAASAATGHAITDPWCSRIAAAHLAFMIESGDDFEKRLVTLTPAQIDEYAETLRPKPVSTY